MENQYFKVGSVQSPINDDPGLLELQAVKDLDPALWHLLYFYYQSIHRHLGDRWNNEVNELGLQHLEDGVIAQVIPYDPLPVSQESGYVFPLMAAYRSEEEYLDKTFSFYQIRAKVDLLYILPPISSPDQSQRLKPFLTQIARTIVDRTSQGFDTQIENGKQWWTDSGIQAIGCVKSNYVNISDTNMIFPALLMELYIEERQEPDLRNYDELQGIDGYIQLDGYQEPLDLIHIQVSE